LNPVRFGLVGAGAVAETHIRAIQSLSDATVVAVADANHARAKSLTARYGIPRSYGSVHELVEDSSVDAVDILVPHHLHLSVATAAARTGRHVLVEKSIAHTVGAADSIIAVCRSGGVILGGIFQNRFTAAGRSLRDAVQQGVLGRPLLATVTVKVRRTAGYYQDAPWRARPNEAGGGVLMIQAIHTLDLLQWVMGMPHRALGWIATRVHQVAVEDIAVGLLEFANGAVAILQATTAAVPEIPPELEIHGDRGSAIVFDSRGYLGFWCSTLDQPVPLPERWKLYASHYHEQEGTVPTQASFEPHAENIRDFVAAVREGRPPQVDGPEARKALLLVDSLYRSAARRMWVDLA
jgi:UDP-N-acetyl-2-amino-2-deoxyglucuronate dehydrogenase